MLTKLTCLRKLLILHILRNGTFLDFIVKTYIIFKSSKTILQLYASEISVFTNSLCIFAILIFIVLNFSASKVQKYFHNNILLNCEKILNIFALTFFNFILAIWQLNTFFIPVFYTVIFIMF